MCLSSSLYPFFLPIHRLVQTVVPTYLFYDSLLVQASSFWAHRKVSVACLMTHRWGCATVFLLGSSHIWSSMNATFRSWNIFYSSSAIFWKSPDSCGWSHSSKKYINPHHKEENSFSEPYPPTQTHSIFRQLSFNGMTCNPYQEL